jgi:DNA processing protein
VEKTCVLYMEQSVDIGDKKYPPALKEALKHLVASSGPKKLYYKGNWCPDIFKNCLAVVGSRHLTSYGRRATEQIITEVAAAGVTIVSGFMYGGDEAAHSSAVRVGGRTIAVMPCGIERIHPESQKKLYQEILDNNGLIISEYEGDAQPQTFTYIQRDRLVAGLSKAVLVTEAALNSGSLITASYAKKYGRKIFALPGQITSEVSKGTFKLIKEGAEPVAEANDILSFYKVLVSQRRPASSSPSNSSSAAIKGSLEEKIIDQLRREPMKADDMARFFAVPVAHLGTTLTIMQLKGFINLENGKYYIN